MPDWTEVSYLNNTLNQNFQKLDDRCTEFDFSVWLDRTSSDYKYIQSWPSTASSYV